MIFGEIMKLLEVQTVEFKNKLPKIYNPEILNELFSSPILSPVSLAQRLNIHYTTASKYLKQLESIALVKGSKVGKYQLYSNYELIKILDR